MTCRGVNHSGQHAPHFEKLPVVKLDAYRGSGERLSARIEKLGLALPFRAVCRQPEVLEHSASLMRRVFVRLG